MSKTKRSPLRIETCVNCHVHFHLDSSHDESIFYQLLKSIKQQISEKNLTQKISIVKNKPWKYLSERNNQQNSKKNKKQYLFFNQITKQLQMFPRVSAFEVYFQNFILYSKLNSSFFPHMETVFSGQKDNQKKDEQQNKNSKQQNSQQRNSSEQSQFSLTNDETEKKKMISISVLSEIIVKIVEFILMKESDLQFLQKMDHVFRFLNLEQQPIHSNLSLVQYVLRNTQNQKINSSNDLFKVFLKLVSSENLPHSFINSTSCSPKKVLPYTSYKSTEKTERIRSIYKNINIKKNNHSSLSAFAPNRKKNANPQPIQNCKQSTNLISFKKVSPSCIQPKQFHKKKNLTGIKSQNNKSCQILKNNDQIKLQQNSDSKNKIRNYKKLKISNFNNSQNNSQQVIENSEQIFGRKSGFIYKVQNLKQNLLKNQILIGNSPNRLISKRDSQNIGRIFNKKNFTQKDLNKVENCSSNFEQSDKIVQYQKENFVNKQKSIEKERKTKEKEQRLSLKHTVRQCISERKYRPSSSTVQSKFKMMQKLRNNRNSSKLSHNQLINRNNFISFRSKENVEGQEKFIRSGLIFLSNSQLGDFKIKKVSVKKSDKDFIKENMDMVNRISRKNSQVKSINLMQSAKNINKKRLFGSGLKGHKKSNSESDKKCHSFCDGKMLSCGEMSFRGDDFLRKGTNEQVSEGKKDQVIMMNENIQEGLINNEDKLRFVSIFSDKTNRQQRNSSNQMASEGRQNKNKILKQDELANLQKIGPSYQEHTLIPVTNQKDLKQAKEKENKLKEFENQQNKDSKNQNQNIKSQNVYFKDESVIKKTSFHHLLDDGSQLHKQKMQKIQTNSQYSQAMIISQLGSIQLKKQSHIFKSLILTQNRQKLSILTKTYPFQQQQSNQTQIRALTQLYDQKQLRMFPSYFNQSKYIQQALKDHNKSPTLLSVVKQIIKINPSLIQRLFQNKNHINHLRFYTLWLFNIKLNDFQFIIVDDKFPTIKNTKNQFPFQQSHQILDKKTQFLHQSPCKQKSIWLMILEKAVAILLGGYHKLQAPSYGQLYQILTGSPYVDLGVLNFDKILKFLTQQKNFSKIKRKKKNLESNQEFIKKSIYATFYKKQDKMSHGNLIKSRIREITDFSLNEKNVRQSLISFGSQFNEGDSFFESMRLGDFVKECQKIEIVFKVLTQKFWQNSIGFQIAILPNRDTKMIEIFIQPQKQDHQNCQFIQQSHDSVIRVVNSNRNQVHQFQPILVKQKSSIKNNNKKVTCRLYHCESNQIHIMHSEEEKFCYKYSGEITKSPSFFFLGHLKQGSNLIVIQNHHINLQKQQNINQIQSLKLSVITSLGKVHLKELTKNEIMKVKLDEYFGSHTQKNQKIKNDSKVKINKNDVKNQKIKIQDVKKDFFKKQYDSDELTMFFENKNKKQQQMAYRVDSFNRQQKSLRDKRSKQKSQLNDSQINSSQHMTKNNQKYSFKNKRFVQDYQ